MTVIFTSLKAMTWLFLMFQDNHRLRQDLLQQATAYGTGNVNVAIPTGSQPGDQMLIITSRLGRATWSVDNSDNSFWIYTSDYSQIISGVCDSGRLV